MRRLARIAVAVAAVLFAGAPALAGEYPIEAPTSALSDASVSCGGATTVSGSGWSQPSVSLSILSTPVSLGDAAVNASGEFSREVSIPFSVGSGSHTIRASGSDLNGAPETVDLAFTVPTCVLGEAEPPGEGGGLAITGGNIAVGLIIFVALLVVGSSALIAGRRRARVKA